VATLNTIDDVPRSAAFEPAPVELRELERDPHGTFRRYRPMTPVLKRDDGVYMAIRAADVEKLGTDPRTRQLETEYIVARGVTAGPLFDFVKYTMLLSNGTEHRRRRAPLARTFGLKMIAELRPRIRTIAADLLDDCVARGGMNFVADYCSLIPARVIAVILGLPAADIPEFTRHVYSLARVFTPAFPSEAIPQMQTSAQKLNLYVEDLLNERSRHPLNDFLTSYLGMIGEPEGLKPLEALSQLVTLIVGGSDTTRTALAIQASLLLQHPQQWQAVCGHHPLIPGAVLESLRYEPSVGSFPRYTLEDIDIDGWVVPRNRILIMSTLSALRDPAACPDPDKFDIARAGSSRRLSVFGAGAHRCLGEALAKAELEEGLAALAARLPDLQLVGAPPVVHGSGGIRRIEGMRVSRSGEAWLLESQG
jgi:cytochrome P450 family 103